MVFVFVAIHLSLKLKNNDTDQLQDFRSYKCRFLNLLDLRKPIPDKSAVKSDHAEDLLSLSSLNCLSTDAPSLRELAPTQQYLVLVRTLIEMLAMSTLIAEMANRLVPAIKALIYRILHLIITQ
jgi:nicotinic acid phosphoribosyltransferase